MRERQTGSLCVESIRRHTDLASPRRACPLPGQLGISRKKLIYAKASRATNPHAEDIRREVDDSTCAAIIEECKFNPVIAFIRSRYDIVKHDPVSLHIWREKAVVKLPRIIRCSLRLAVRSNRLIECGRGSAPAVRPDDAESAARSGGRWDRGAAAAAKPRAGVRGVRSVPGRNSGRRIGNCNISPT